MAAVPFGGHPTFGAYVAWAREQGCEVQSGVTADESGQAHTLTKIEAPSGRHVIVVGVNQTEHLVPTMVSHLNRRLGLKSPWFALPDDAE